MNDQKVRILPLKVDNEFKGHVISKYMFLFITLITLVRSLIHIFALDGGAQSIATIPLDSYSSASAATVIMMFALWGLSQLLMGIVYGVVYFKYQSLIPAMYILLIIEYSMRIFIGQIKPIITVSQAPGGIGNLILIPLCIFMLILSLRHKDTFKAISTEKFR